MTMTSTKKVSDLRIVLLGKTGSGKSATGNTILGRNAFEVVDFIKSAGKLCEKQEGEVGGKTVSVIDTPGLFNTAVTKQQLKTDLQKCVSMSAPGPHVFLLVLKLGVRFTKEERDTVKWIQENFGKDALGRTVILFTHADQLKGKTLEEYIRKSDDLQEIVHSCGDRYHSFNNEERNTRGQVTELLKKINTIKQTNEVSHYTIEMFEKAQMAIALAVVVVFVICIWNFYTLTPPQLEKLPAREKNLQKKTPLHLHKELSSQLQEKDSTCSISRKNYYWYESNRSSKKCKVTAGEDDVTAAGEDDVTAAVDDVTAAGDDVTAVVDDVTAARDDVTAAVDDVTAAGDDVTAAGDDVTAVVDDVTAARDDVTAAGEDDVTAAVDDVTAAGEDDVTAAVDDVTAAGDDVTAVVDDVTAARDDVTAAGEDVTAAGDDVTAAGDDVTAAGDDVTAVVDDVTAAGDDVTAAGDDVTAAGEDDVTAAVDDVTAAGDDVTAAGEDDVTAAVDDVTAARDDVTAAVDDVTATGDDVTAAGDDVTIF